MTLHRVLLCFIFAASAYLSLANLNSPSLWDDEAHVAFFARSFLQSGHWSAWDGRNLLADRNGHGLDSHFNHIMPQLDYGIVAASFRIFGVSTWSARLPFAIAGVASLFAFVWLLRLEFPGAAALELYALACLAFSTNFLMHIRTGRYYAVSTLLMLVACACYRRFLQTKGLRFTLIIGAAASLLVLNSALNCGAFLLMLGARYLLFDRSKIGRQDWGKIAWSAAVFSSIALPYGWFCVRPGSAAANAEVASSGLAAPWVTSALTRLWWNLRELNAINALPWAFLLCLIYFILRSKKEHSKVKSTALEWAVMTLTYIIFLSMFSPQPVKATTIADIRYLSPIFPLLAGICGVVLWYIHQASLVTAIIAGAIFINCNLFAFSAFSPQWRWLLPSFVKEINEPYPTGTSEVVAFMKENAHQDDSLWVCPDYMNKPLNFYLGDLLRLGGSLNHHTQIPFANIHSLHAPVLMEEFFPDWIVSFGAQAELNSAIQFFSRQQTEAPALPYHYELVKVLDVYWGQTQRPELLWHNFGPLKTFNKQTESVFIFKRSQSPH